MHWLVEMCKLIGKKKNCQDPGVSLEKAGIALFVARYPTASSKSPLSVLEENK